MGQALWSFIRAGSMGIKRDPLSKWYQISRGSQGLPRKEMWSLGLKTKKGLTRKIYASTFCELVESDRTDRLTEPGSHIRYRSCQPYMPGDPAKLSSFQERSKSMLFMCMSMIIPGSLTEKFWGDLHGLQAAEILILPSLMSLVLRVFIILKYFQ